MGQNTKFPTRPLWGRRVLLSLLLLGAVYLAVVALASRFLDPEVVADLLEPRVEELLSRDVEISSAEVGFFPLSMRIQDVSVSDPTGSAPTLARIESVEFQVGLIPLLRRQVQVRRVLIRNPEAFLRVAADGSSNFGDFASETPAHASEEEAQLSGGPVDLDLRGIRVLGGRLDFVDEEKSIAHEVRDFSLQADVEHVAGESWIFLGTLEGTVASGSTQNGPTSWGNPFPVRLSFDAKATSDLQDVEIRTGQLTVDPVSVALSGEVRGLQDPVRNLSVRLEGDGIPLSQVIEAIPGPLRDSLGVRGEGTVSLALAATGEMGSGLRPELSGNLTLASGTLFGEDDALLAQHLVMGIEILPQGMLDIEAEGEVLEGPFSLEGTAGWQNGRALDLQLDAYPELSLAHSVLQLSEGTELQGRIRAVVRITGSAKDPGSLRYWGEASPSELRFTTNALAVPVTIHDGQFDIQGESATFRDLSLSLGRDRFSADGALGNLSALSQPRETLELRGSVRGSRLDLTTLKANDPPDPNLTYGKVAFARLGGRSLAGWTEEDAAKELRLSRPDSIPLAGEISLVLDTLVDARGQMEDVRATMVFGPDFLRVADARFRRYGGTLQASMALELGRNSEQPFSLRLNAEGVEAPEFLSATSPLGSVIRGTLSLQMDLAGTLDALLLPNAPSLVGSGSFSIRDGGVNSTVVTESLSTFLGMNEFRAPDFQAWSSSFLLRDGRVQLAEANLVGAPGEPRLGGGIGMDGGLDLLSAFSLPTARLGTYAMGNLGVAGEAAGRVINRPDVIQAVVRIGGSLLRPELEADPGAAMSELGATVGGEARVETQRLIREQTANLQSRASGFLRGLTRSPDTVAPDTVQPDTIQPDTIRPDTIKPDTTQIH